MTNMSQRMSSFAKDFKGKSRESVLQNTRC